VPSLRLSLRSSLPTSRLHFLCPSFPPGRRSCKYRRSGYALPPDGLRIQELDGIRRLPFSSFSPSSEIPPSCTFQIASEVNDN
jgi:hypothetical protein